MTLLVHLLGLVLLAWGAVVFLALFGAPRALALGLVLLGGSSVASARESATRDAVFAVAGIQPGAVAATCGVPGTGKTYVTRAASSWWPRVVIFDPYAAKDAGRVARGLSHRAAWDGERTNVARLLADSSPFDRDAFRLVVSGDPFRLDPAELARDFATLAELCWHSEDVCLVAEEAALYGREATALVNRVSTGGAHAGMAFVLVCQSVSRLPIDARRNLGLLVCGAQGAPEDVDAIKDRCGREFARRVAALAGPDPGPADAPLVWRLGDGLRENGA